MNNKFRMILLYVSIIILLISTSYIVFDNFNSIQEKNLFEELKGIKNGEKALLEKEETESKQQDNSEKSILLEYEELYKENKDLYGWINIEDTTIDYPVMHTPNLPNFYIDKNWKKEESESGSIFIDARTGSETENIIIYGHKMKDGSMFGNLEKYKEKEYYEQHKYIEFDTIYEKKTYEIIAIAKAIIFYENKPQDEYLFYEHVELNTEKEYEDYINYMKNNSYYEIETTARYGEELITLCTCDYWAEDARLLIIAKRIK